MQKFQHDLGSLVLRLVGGGMMLYAHGLDKLLNFKAKADYFPDPLKIGATPSLSLAVFGEVFCALAVALGFKTRYAVIPPMAVMAVAAFVVHAGDPFRKKEMALLYLAIYVGVWCMGSGTYSLDHLLKKLKQGKKAG